MKNVVSIMVAGVVLATAPCGTAPAEAQSLVPFAQRCLSAKAKAAEKAVSALLRCHERVLAGRRVGGVDGLCVTRALERLTENFAKAEAQGGGFCAGSGDAVAVAPVVTRAVSEVVAAVAGTAPFGGCGPRGDGLTCGGTCDVGTTCMWSSSTGCYCVPVQWTCPELLQPGAFCPAFGQSCDPGTGTCQ